MFHPRNSNPPAGPGRSNLRNGVQPVRLKNSDRSGRRRGEEMSVFEEHKTELEHYETMMGSQRGRLAVTLDLLTNALVLVGQHGVYCRSSRDPGQPVLDIRMITNELGKAKELIQSVMEELRAQRQTQAPL